MMDDALGDLEFCFVYMDDLLVACKDEVEHVEHLWVIFQRLREAGLVLNVEKCQFGVPSVDYLGHHVDAAGVSLLPSSVAAVKNFPQPVSTKQMMSFLGMLNFYQRFIPGAARMLKPLTDALKGKPQKELTWSEEMKTSFSRSKEALPRGNFGPSRSSGTCFLGGGCVRHARGSGVAAASTRGRPTATGFLLEEAGPCSEEVFSFRQGAAGVLPGSEAFPPSA